MNGRLGVLFISKFCSATGPVYPANFLTLDMFKRVEKRQRKKEEEAELGLDEDMKQVLGMNDTDSEESASDTDDSESNGAEGSGQEEVYDSDAEERVHEQDEGDESEDETSLPVITVQEALRDPVYIISLEPNVKGCILCPRKILKGAKMVELHRTSNACTLPLSLKGSWTYMFYPLGS